MFRNAAHRPSLISRNAYRDQALKVHSFNHEYLVPLTFPYRVYLRRRYLRWSCCRDEVPEALWGACCCWAAVGKRKERLTTNNKSIREKLKSQYFLKSKPGSYQPLFSRNKHLLYSHCRPLRVGFRDDTSEHTGRSLVLE